ncbi:hypothetical protein [Erythrobacter mangrovi]|uniref:DUF995 domain-containing protein n=1 Tax=Erythrobacter mangrovi TaxID=2739433 RepID=A0A7D4BA82_9SPHN|nr:hypothetical protein [Erythrobacter mangrovi]QKG70706.1 hypothetical protein HQR01_04600 [Erythrobacter mangrovi]
MRQALLIGLALSIPGCAQAPDPPPSDTTTASATAAAGEQASTGIPQAFAETAWRAQGRDGSQYITYLDSDGTYRDLRNGDPWQTGTWTYDLAGENRLCFTPDDENGAERCWRPERMHGKAMDVIGGPEARRVELEPVAYEPADPKDENPA